MAGASVGQRLAQINSRIESAARRAGRAPESVRLLAVSKLKPVADLREAWDAGQRDFGENYAQEAAAKIDAWTDLPGVTPVAWHFIGRLQSNKVRQIANRFAFVHSVDRLDIALRLDRATVSRQDIFIQYNVADEASKGGVDAAELSRLVERVCAECPRLRVCGLMVMPPLSDDPEATRPHFRRARETLASLRARLTTHPLDQLSMGTSGDFEVAIEEGATWVRIGTDVFGPRT